MKKLLYFAFLSFFAFFGVSKANTETVTWMVDGVNYATTTCESGGDIILPNPPSKPGYVFRGWRLAYTPIEYLESTGTQYIDTGVVGDLNTEYEITVKTNVFGAIFGSRTSATENTIMSAYTSTGIINDFGDYTVTRQVPMISYVTTHRYKLTNGKSKRTVTDLDTGWTDTVTTEYSGSLTTPKNLYIGYAGSLGGLAGVANLCGNIYGCKIYDNGTLVRDFIPVLDIDGIPCMYDKVTNQFFYNAGTGQFIAGPAISE